MRGDAARSSLTGATASLGSARFSGVAIRGKFELGALAQSMAREFGPQGVRVAHAIMRAPTHLQ